MPLWEPTHPGSWAETLGLVHVPLFAQADVPRVRADHAVLLDGAAVSFHLVTADDPEAALSDTNLQWAWSSNLTHSVAIHRTGGVLFLRRWDDRDAIRKFALPSRPKGAEDLLDILRAAATPRGADVVLHMLRAFRAIRSVPPNDNPLVALQLFNVALVAAEAIERGKLGHDALTRSRTFAALIESLEHAGIDETLLRATGLDRGGVDAKLEAFPAVLEYFVAPEPQQQYLLVPSLLMRHASGQLFQEAHLVLEREQRQLSFAGFVSPVTGVSTRRDVRFTPTTLARALVEEALAAFCAARSGALPDTLTILDPACGSGVFLLETIRALIYRHYHGSVHLRGFDVSPLSVTMARFCLAHAVHDARDAGFEVTISIEERNALTDDWGTADILLMNPPFVPWESMDPADQVAVRNVLGTLMRGRSDKAMAFILRAARSLSHGGSLASVLPTALLETASGEKWREALAEEGELHFIGRFEGFGYFRASMVEPAFIVLRRANRLATPHEVVVLLARETAEDEALRALRLYRRGEGHGSVERKWDLFSASSTMFSPKSWMPRTHGEQQLLEILLDRDVPRVADLFDVRQGARTGANDVFLLTHDELAQLPRRERRFFRPAADNSTIQGGRLLETEYVFYPYGASELVIASEDDLATKLRHYYETRLKPAKEQLAKRAGALSNAWWRLTREREWQHKEVPKLVSTYFGDRGSFAYDDTGRFVVVQGHGWFWRHEPLAVSDPADPELSVILQFDETTLPWAYLALLNTQLFERLLSIECPRVQGGQFNLSARFVKNVFLPNLFSEVAVPPDVVADLAQLGRRLHAGEKYPKTELEELAARSFGVPRRLVVASDE